MNEVQRWLAQAARDLRTAENNSKSGDYYAASFFCQQAAEKALKGVLIHRGKEVAKAHNLVFLGKGVGVPESLLPGLEKLSIAYVESRYPDLPGGLPADKFTKAETAVHLSIAKEVLVWANQRISKN